MGEMRYAYKFFVAKSDGKTAFGRPKSRWEEIGCEDIDWIHLAQDRTEWRALENTVLNL
jgi:hypothetical protein